MKSCIALLSVSALFSPIIRASPLIQNTAAPDLVETRDDSNRTLWGPEQGNTWVEIGDGEIRLGSQPPWYILDTLNLAENCGSIACDNDDWEVESQFVTSIGGINSQNLVVHVEGSFAVDLKGELVEALKRISGLGEVYKHEEKEGCTRLCVGRVCELGACSGDIQTLSEYTTSNRFSIRREDESGTSFITVTISLEEEEGIGFCDFITAAGGAIARAIPATAPASGLFSVAGVFCSLL